MGSKSVVVVVVFWLAMTERRAWTKLIGDDGQVTTCDFALTRTGTQHPGRIRQSVREPRSNSDSSLLFRWPDRTTCCKSLFTSFSTPEKYSTNQDTASGGHTQKVWAWRWSQPPGTQKRKKTCQELPLLLGPVPVGPFFFISSIGKTPRTKWVQRGQIWGLSESWVTCLSSDLRGHLRPYKRSPCKSGCTEDEFPLNTYVTRV